MNIEKHGIVWTRNSTNYSSKRAKGSRPHQQRNHKKRKNSPRARRQLVVALAEAVAALTLVILLTSVSMGAF